MPACWEADHRSVPVSAVQFVADRRLNDGAKASAPPSEQKKPDLVEPIPDAAASDKELDNMLKESQGMTVKTLETPFASPIMKELKHQIQ